MAIGFQILIWQFPILEYMRTGIFYLMTNFKSFTISWYGKYKIKKIKKHCHNYIAILYLNNVLMFVVVGAVVQR